MVTRFATRRWLRYGPAVEVVSRWHRASPSSARWISPRLPSSFISLVLRVKSPAPRHFRHVGQFGRVPPTLDDAGPTSQALPPTLLTVLERPGGHPVNSAAAG